MGRLPVHSFTSMLHIHSTPDHNKACCGWNQVLVTGFVAVHISAFFFSIVIKKQLFTSWCYSLGIDDATRPYSFSESLDEVWTVSLTKANPSPVPPWPDSGGFPSSGLPVASDSIRERLKRRSGYWLLSKGMRWTHRTCVFRLPFCEALYGQYWHWNGLWPAGQRHRIIFWAFPRNIWANTHMNIETFESCLCYSVIKSS